MENKLYKHPIIKDKFITKEEYFEVINSKAYSFYLDNFNFPIKDVK